MAVRRNRAMRKRLRDGFETGQKQTWSKYSARQVHRLPEDARRTARKRPQAGQLASLINLENTLTSISACLVRAVEPVVGDSCLV